MTAILAAIMLAAGLPAARPSEPPPSATGPLAVPAAWVASASGSQWLTTGSYCWTAKGKGACVDTAGPSLPDLARLPAERGETLTFVRAARGGDVSYYGALRVSPSSG